MIYDKNSKVKYATLYSTSGNGQLHLSQNKCDEKNQFTFILHWNFAIKLKEAQFYVKQHYSLEALLKEFTQDN